MSTYPRCTCTSCTIRGLMGPAIVTTLGILFLLSEFRHGSASIGHTFPILFIVIGIILLASAVAQSPVIGFIDELVDAPNDHFIMGRRGLGDDVFPGQDDGW